MPAASSAADDLWFDDVAGEMPQMSQSFVALEEIQFSDADFVAIVESIATTENEANNDTGNDVWRWERFGHGKYRGRYYRWRRIGDAKRRTLSGGRIDLKGEANLPKRKGRGNHAKSEARQSATKHPARRDGAGMAGDFVANETQRATSWFENAMPLNLA